MIRDRVAAHRRVHTPRHPRLNVKRRDAEITPKLAEIMHKLQDTT
jgi:hypothetical protein